MSEPQQNWLARMEAEGRVVYGPSWWPFDVCDRFNERTGRFETVVCLPSPAPDDEPTPSHWMAL